MKQWNLTPDAIHIWTIDLNQTVSVANWQQWWDWLDDREKRSADRFKFEKDRQHYVISHAHVRRLLSQYLACQPQEIIFGQQRHGKPFIASQHPLSHLKFNLSHSHELAAVAITLEEEIGVDLEHHKTLSWQNEIVDRFFSVAERQQYYQFPIEQRLNTFYRLWTCKEAFIKALGLGIFKALDSFDIQLLEAPQAKVITKQEVADKDWNLHELSLQEAYSAAVAWQGFQKKIQYGGLI